MKQNQTTTDEKTRKDLVEYILYKTGNLLDADTEHRFVEYLERQKEQKEPFSCGHENGGDSEKPEVDLEKDEMIETTLSLFYEEKGFIGGFNAALEIAKYFYELGLNARKEESK